MEQLDYIDSVRERLCDLLENEEDPVVLRLVMLTVKVYYKGSVETDNSDEMTEIRDIVIDRLTDLDSDTFAAEIDLVGSITLSGYHNRQVRQNDYSSRCYYSLYFVLLMLLIR